MSENIDLSEGFNIPENPIVARIEIPLRNYVTVLNGLKVCARCKMEKPSTTEYFGIDRKRKDGLYVYCIDCRRLMYYNGNLPIDTTYEKDGVLYRKCSRCKSEKLLDDNSFYKLRGEERTKFTSICKTCLIQYNSASQWYKHNPEARKRVRRRQTLKTYGLTENDFNSMYSKQGGKCGSCGDEFTKENIPHIDHDHFTGVVVGLLCNNCNNGLGRFKHNPDRLRKAAAYAEKHQELIRSKLTSNITVLKSNSMSGVINA